MKFLYMFSILIVLSLGFGFLANKYVKPKSSKEILLTNLKLNFCKIQEVKKDTVYYKSSRFRNKGKDTIVKLKFSLKDFPNRSFKPKENLLELVNLSKK